MPQNSRVPRHEFGAGGPIAQPCWGKDGKAPETMGLDSGGAAPVRGRNERKQAKNKF